MTIHRTWSQINPRRSGGSFAESSAGSVKVKGFVNIEHLLNIYCMNGHVLSC